MKSWSAHPDPEKRSRATNPQSKPERRSRSTNPKASNNIAGGEPPKPYKKIGATKPTKPEKAMFVGNPQTLKEDRGWQTPNPRTSLNLKGAGWQTTSTERSSRVENRKSRKKIARKPCNARRFSTGKPHTLREDGWGQTSKPAARSSETENKVPGRKLARPRPK